MQRNNVAEVLEPEHVVAFFVPNHVAGYVTELLELALGQVPGVSVSAGTLTNIPINVGAPLSYLRNRDGAALPDLDVTPKESQNRTPSATTTPKVGAVPRRKSTKRKKGKRGKAKKCSPESETYCCPQRMAEKLQEVYGVPEPDLATGTASAPRVMIQYPDLPYLVPVTQSFKDVGVPRNVVDFCYNAVFTAESNELLPVLKTD